MTVRFSITELAALVDFITNCPTRSNVEAVLRDGVPVELSEMACRDLIAALETEIAQQHESPAKCSEKTLSLDQLANKLIGVLTVS